LGGVMSAKLLIYIYKIFSSSSSSREKMAWFQGSSEKRVISLLQKLLVVHRVFPLSCSHNFLSLPPVKKRWNLGTLEPDIEKALQIKYLHGSNFFKKWRFTGT